MRNKDRIRKLERAARPKIKGIRFYKAVPDEWEGEVPEGYMRLADIPEEPDTVRFIFCIWPE